MALVESQIIASTPSSPSFASAASSVRGPISGSGSSFQSPVWNTVPAGVRMTSACASGMECVMRMKLQRERRQFEEPPGGTTCIVTSFSRRASASLRRSTAAANGVT